MIERHDPFGRMMSLRQMMDRLMEDAFIMPRERGRATGEGGGLAIDLYEEGDNFVVEAQLPGVKPEDIDINVENGVLTIRGETKSEQQRTERNYVIREQRSGRFSRSIRLPETADPDASQATFDHGVLRLTLPKSERARPRRIPIQSGSQAGRQESIPSAGQTGGQASGSRAESGERSSQDESSADAVKSTAAG